MLREIIIGRKKPSMYFTTRSKYLYGDGIFSRKYRRILLCMFFLCILIVCIATAIVVGVFLSQQSVPKSKIPTRSMNATLRWNSTGVTVAGVVGVVGANASLLNMPYGLAFDSSNILHIADYQNNRIQKVISGSSMTVTVAGSSNGISGNAAHQFNLSTDILFDANDNLYITDRGNNRVQLWTKGATSGITVAGRN